jgi:excisionase family DNA binding protein
MLESAQFIDRKKEVEMGKYLTIGEVAGMLGISRGSIYRYIAEGRLPVKKEEFGDRILFKFLLEDIDQFKEMLKKKRRKGQRLI